jgi:RNA-directed DNA polymerase
MHNGGPVFYIMEVKDKHKKKYNYTERAEKFLRVRNLYQFQSLLKLDPFLLNYHLNKPIYFNFQIPKKKGGRRIIQSPNEALKEMQQTLNYYLQAVYYSLKPKSVHGFVFNPNGIEAAFNIVSNASHHCNKKTVLNMDLKDFFSSITAKQVKHVLMSPPFDLKDEVATVIALLGTFEKKLPTGAPTSPVLSNMVCYQMDKQLEEYCSTCDLTYTRYADDLTFSSNSKIPNRVIDELNCIITNFGFQLNEKKFRIQSSASKQMVTGLVVNKRVNVDRKYIRNLRAILFSCEKMGIELACAKHYQLTDLKLVDIPKFVRKIKGQIEFVGQVRGVNDSIYKKLKSKFQGNLNTQ